MKYRLLSLLFIGLLFSACEEEKVAEVKEAIRPVRFAKVIKSGSASKHTFSGTSQSSKEAKLSFKVAGTLNKINVKVGDKVSRGQVIASVDAIDYSIERDQVLASLKNAETQIKSAETQRVATKSAYQRVEKLYENNSVPLSEYEEAKAAYEAAESQYEAAQAQVAASKKQLQAAGNQVSYARLTAPFAGVITAIEVEENELVNSGTPIAVLSAEGKPEVRVGVPESYISNIRKGQEVDIHFSILADKDFKGRVSEVAYSSSEASTYPVILTVDKASKELRPGMAANVTFSNQTSKNQKELIMAPAKAIGEGPNGHFAFLLKQEGELYVVKKANIEIGNLMPEGFEIKNGLKEGELVATAGLQALLDGMKVKLLQE